MGHAADIIEQRNHGADTVKRQAAETAPLRTLAEVLGGSDRRPSVGSKILKKLRNYRGSPA
jgi:hypothetical protein